MTVREVLEAQEERVLSPYAQRSANSKGRQVPEPECPVRTAFQRDRDRILHCKAFRRLTHKTQVFLAPAGDHYRTRLTHTLEVAQIARTIARALHLNESLTEAIALAHDLGHTPFGHAGESVLDRLLPGGFRHHEQSLRVVERLERDGRGLNLTAEVRDGIVKHSKGREGDPLLPAADGPATLEGQIIRVADLIAYVNHDIDDAVRGGMLREADLPGEYTGVVGRSRTERIGTMVRSVIGESLDQPRIVMGEAVRGAVLGLRAFLFDRVYFNPESRREFDKAIAIVESLYRHFLSHPGEIPPEILAANQPGDILRAVADYLAGMTDRYALATYERLFLPKPWAVL
jgi:dGTPase